MGWAILIASILATIGAVVGYHFDILGVAGQELGAYDNGLAFWTKHPKRSTQVVVIALDDRTLHEIEKDPILKRNYGTWPYARGLWAIILQYLTQKVGARAIVLDALMTERRADDESLVEVIKQMQAPLYLGFTVDPEGLELPKVVAKNQFPDTLPKEKLTQPTSFFSAIPQPTSSSAELSQKAAQALAFPVLTQDLSLPSFPQVEQFDSEGHLLGNKLLLPQPPIEPLLEALPGFGLVSTETEDSPDGKMRQTRFAYSDEKNSYVTLSVAVVADLFHADHIEIRPNQLTIGSHVFAINQDGSAGIDYGGSFSERFQVISLIDVLLAARQSLTPTNANNEQLRLQHKLEDWLKDRIVLIGGFAAGTADLKATPFDPFVPGVVKHASEIDNFLTGRFLVKAPLFWSILLTFLVSLVSVAFVLVVHSQRLEVAWPIALFFLLYLGPGFLLAHWKIHVLSVMPSVGGTLASIGVTLYQQFFVMKEREMFRELFSHYMEPDLVDQLVESHKLPTLRGEMREITVFVSDNRFFSLLSHAFRHDPTKLMAILNRYLASISNLLVKSGACIDKYVRGAVIALFGAPVSHRDHALRACRSALAITSAMEQLRLDMASQGLPEIPVRIGLNTDTMLVGNIGSEQLFDYTALGEGMDLAIHFEHLTTLYGLFILIGPKTYEQTKEWIEVREVDRIRIPGTEERVSIYELLSLKGQLPIHTRQWISIYQVALKLYREARFLQVLPLLAEILTLAPHDEPTHLLRKACQRNILFPPSESFSGTVIEEDLLRGGSK